MSWSEFGRVRSAPLLEGDLAPCPLCGDRGTPRLVYHVCGILARTADRWQHVNCVICGAHWLEPWPITWAPAPCASCGQPTLRRIVAGTPKDWVPEGGWQRALPLMLLRECDACARLTMIDVLRRRQLNEQILPRIRAAEAIDLAALEAA